MRIDSSDLANSVDTVDFNDDDKKTSEPGTVIDHEDTNKNHDPKETGLSVPFVFEYQQTSIAELADSNNNKRILCDEMGLGKTLQMISVIHKKRLEQQAQSTNYPDLVVVPKEQMIDQWEIEFLDKSTYAKKAQENLIVLKSISDVDKLVEDIKQNESFIDNKIVITHYDVIKHTNSKKSKTGREKRRLKKRKINWKIDGDHQYTQTDKGTEESYVKSYEDAATKEVKKVKIKRTMRVSNPKRDMYFEKRYVELNDEETREIKKVKIKLTRPVFKTAKLITVKKDTQYFFSRQNWNVMVLDEVHKMGSIMSYRFDGLRPTSNDFIVDDDDYDFDTNGGGIKAKFRYALTGTPVVNSMHEIVAAIAVTDPKFDYAGYRKELTKVAEAMGGYTTYLKCGQPFRVNVFTNPEVMLKTLIRQNPKSAGKTISTIKTTVDLLREYYIIRTFEILKDDFKKAPQPFLRRDYSVQHKQLELDYRREKIAEDISKVNQQFNHSWDSECGPSTVFHVNGKKNNSVSPVDSGQQDVNTRRSVSVRANRIINSEKLEVLIQYLLSADHQSLVLAADTVSERNNLRKALRGIGFTHVYTDKDILAYKDSVKQSKYNQMSQPLHSTGEAETSSDHGSSLTTSATASENTPLARLLENNSRHGKASTCSPTQIDNMLRRRNSTGYDLGAKDVHGNRLFVHVIVNPYIGDDVNDNGLNQLEQQCIDYISNNKNRYLAELFEEGILGMSGFSKSICFGKTALVRCILQVIDSFLAEEMINEKDRNFLWQQIEKAAEYQYSDYHSANTKKYLQDQRSDNIQCARSMFKKKDMKILIIPTKSEGLDLHCADALIRFGMSKSLAEKQQLEARINRIGQLNNITMVSFCPVTKIEKLYADVVQKQSETITMFLDTGKHSEEKTNVVALFFLANALLDIIQNANPSSRKDMKEHESELLSLLEKLALDPTSLPVNSLKRAEALQQDYESQITALLELVEKGEMVKDNESVKVLEEKLWVIEAIKQKFKEMNLLRNLILIRNHYINKRETFIADYQTVCRQIQAERPRQVVPAIQEPDTSNKKRKKQPSSDTNVLAASSRAGSSILKEDEDTEMSDQTNSFQNYGDMSFFTMPNVDFDAALDGIGDINELLSTDEMAALMENTW
jgi:hypothetical protein